MLAEIAQIEEVAAGVAAGAAERYGSVACPGKPAACSRRPQCCVGVVASSCSELTAVIGVGELAMSEITREPVTTMVSGDFCAPWPAPPGAGLGADRRAEHTGKQCNYRYGIF